MTINRQILMHNLANRGKAAVAKSLRCLDQRKHCRYRREAEGYAELCQLLSGKITTIAYFTDDGKWHREVVWICESQTAV